MEPCRKVGTDFIVPTHSFILGYCQGGGGSKFVLVPMFSRAVGMGGGFCPRALVKRGGVSSIAEGLHLEELPWFSSYHDKVFHVL